MSDHILTFLESPFAGDVERNIIYARRATRDSLLRGEAPMVSHLLYTQDGILDDLIPEERKHGIDAGLAWGKVAVKSVVYTDYGISGGMKYGIAAAEACGRPIEYRQIGENPSITKEEPCVVCDSTIGTVFGPDPLNNKLSGGTSAPMWFCAECRQQSERECLRLDE